MRQENTPWNESYKKTDLAKELVSKRRPIQASETQRANASKWDRPFWINHEKATVPRKLHADDIAAAENRRRIEEIQEARRIKEEAGEVWE